MCRLLIRQSNQTVAITNGCPNAQVVMGEHVETPQREDQEHLRRPATDPPHLRELLHDPFARQPANLPKVNRLPRRKSL